MIRVTHIITDLDTGGAETTLHKLLSTCDRSRFEMSVISLTSIGAIGQQIQQLGVPVEAMGMQPGKISPLDVLRLRKAIKLSSPHVVQTWLYHADLIGGIAARLAGVPVIWGIRSLMRDESCVKRSTLMVRRLCARLSGLIPSKIVACAVEAERLHTSLGYRANKMMVIPNGYDLARYRPNADARTAVRNELGIPEDALLVGLVGRYDPQKDHKNFLNSFKLVQDYGDNIYCLLCGKDITWENDKLTGWIDELGLRDRVRLLGPRTDVPRLLAALDASVLSSCSEAFPNVVAEAMACGVPCAVTDVGDAALIVGDTGKVAPPSDPKALADAISGLLRMPSQARTELGASARRRIETEFSLTAVTARYEALYKEIAQRCAV